MNCLDDLSKTSGVPTSMSHTIAVISGDPVERAALRSFLQRQEYQVVEIHFQPAAIVPPCRDSIDLVLLDLPSLAGLQERENILAWIREWRHVPIMIMMMQADANQAVSLLNAGIDNYLLKPFRRDELLAKVRALLRRFTRPRVDYTSGYQIDIAGLRIDLAARRAFVDNRDIHLTRKEFFLLAELALRPDAVCTHEELLAKVWGGEYWDANHYLHVYFGRIRKKMGARCGKLIETIPGMGYMLHSLPPAAVPLTEHGARRALTTVGK